MPTLLSFDFLVHPSSSSFIVVFTAHRWILPRLLLGYAPDALFPPSPLDFLPVVALALQQGLSWRLLTLRDIPINLFIIMVMRFAR